MFLEPLEKYYAITFHTPLLFFKIKSKLSPIYLTDLLPSSTKETPMYNFMRTSYPVPQVLKK